MADSVRRVVLQALLCCSLVASCTGDCRNYVEKIEAKINGSSHPHFLTVTEGETVSIPCNIHYYNSSRRVQLKIPQWYVQTSEHQTYSVVKQGFPHPHGIARLEKISNQRNILTLENLDHPDTVIALRCVVHLRDNARGVDCTEMDKHSVVITVVKKITQVESTTTREATGTNSINTTAESSTTDDIQKPTRKDPYPTIASVEQFKLQGELGGTTAPLPSSSPSPPLPRWFPLAICGLLGAVIALVLLVLTLIIFIAHSTRRIAKLLEQNDYWPNKPNSINPPSDSTSFCQPLQIQPTQDGRASMGTTNSRAEHYKNPAVDEDHSSHYDSAGTTALP